MFDEIEKCLDCGMGELYVPEADHWTNNIISIAGTKGFLRCDNCASVFTIEFLTDVYMQNLAKIQPLGTDVSKILTIKPTMKTQRKCDGVGGCVYPSCACMYL